MSEIISKNITEELVDIFLDECMQDSNCCRCEQCRADVRAYALNHLPPQYVATRAGDLFVRVDSMTNQSKANIITAIVSAINTVSRNPRHDINQNTPM